MAEAGAFMTGKTGPTVIVVDDDDAVRHSLQFALELEGFQVRTYGNGEQLLSAGLIARGGCLVIDYSMPGLDGLALLARLRANGVCVPAILISARLTEDVRRRAAEAGYRRILEKPLEGPALVDCIRQATSPDVGGSGTSLR
ncbi:response regulator [Bosea sp. TND4EK4]|uniref:response regulator transcription factor n=1 Tax=Bosea sp. TND4EK4 TaxID=1907408 RepID=UPI001FCD060A|nr:response regulator [Bosea sp. TND4EK4]